MNDVIGIIVSGFEIKYMVEELFESDVKNKKIIKDMLDENKIYLSSLITERV